jgi:hypothetical protein
MKNIINALLGAQVIAQGAVLNGHEVLGITLDKWWALSDTLWSVLAVFILVGVPILTIRKKVAQGKRERSMLAHPSRVVGR